MMLHGAMRAALATALPTCFSPACGSAFPVVPGGSHALCLILLWSYDQAECNWSYIHCGCSLSLRGASSTDVIPRNDGNYTPGSCSAEGMRRFPHDCCRHHLVRRLIGLTSWRSLVVCVCADVSVYANPHVALMWVKAATFIRNMIATAIHHGLFLCQWAVQTYFIIGYGMRTFLMCIFPLPRSAWLGIS